jgi:transposase
MAVSNDTVLRHLRRGVQITYDKKPRAVGMDDWAWEKEQDYGTILVDLERRTVADLLPERSARQVEHWLEQHPSVEMVSRDSVRFICPGRATRSPSAQQVADRLHLFINLREAVEHELSRQRLRLFYVDPSRSELTTNTRLGNRPRVQPNAERAAQYRDVVSERRAIH